DAERHPGDRGVGGSDARAHLAGLEMPGDLDDLAEAIEGQTDPDLEAAVQRVKARVAAVTWQAFWAQVVDGQSAAEVAQQLGIGVASVYQARYRVSHLLAQEYSGPH